MSKAAQRDRHSRRPQKPQEQTRISSGGAKKISGVLILVVIVILASIPFGLGKYIEVSSPDAFDSGAYIYSAKHILAGARIGIDEKPSARLGTLLVNILGVWLFGFNETGPELIMAILQIIALVLMFVSMRKLFGTLSGAVCVIIASVYLSSPLIAKYGNVKEQYMIAFMVSGISCFVLYQLEEGRNKWWLAMLAGAFLSWAPLFKETGTSAIGAIGIFVIAQPLLRHRSLKQTGIDIVLLLGGAAIAIAPLYVWIIGWDVRMRLPYNFVWNVPVKMVMSLVPAGEQAKPASDYIGIGRELVPFSQQWPRVLRYYGLLILPIVLAMAAILARWVRMFMRAIGKLSAEDKRKYDRFVLLFGVWWLLDMAFVWISSRSYEQYYLPLNASAAMLGGYVIVLYRDRVRGTIHKAGWRAVGIAGVACMVAMSWHIFFGITRSPHSGRSYGERRRGYAQKLREASRRREKGLKSSWEIAGEYIREHSRPDDKIYVWGWFPGIYVKAQRFSASSRAFMMPRPAPQVLAKNIDEVLAEFARRRPKFIVDSRKRNIPMERPPYELWPIAPKGFNRATKAWFLPNDKLVIDKYDRRFTKYLRDRFDKDEAKRYEILASLRKFVMDNYEIVESSRYVQTKNSDRPDGLKLYHRMFGEHIVFKLKEPDVN